MAATSPSTGAPARTGAVAATRWDELRVFLLLTVVLAPVLAVMIVGGYGFLIWMYQIVAGAPGAPAL
jgi:nitrate reductase NapE